MKTLKIVVIGAGSKEFSRGIICDLLLEKRLVEERNIELCLVDINLEAAKIMASYAKRACEAMKSKNINIKTARNWVDVLEGADYVLTAVEIKRMELWEQDFRVPASFGIKHVYGENGGPGAMFHALRNFEIIMPLAKDIEKYSPNATLINFTNPEARILKTILTLTKVKAVGLCHGFYDFYNLFAKIMEKDYNDYTITTAGMNHFFACLKIIDKKTGKDIYSDFMKKLESKKDTLEPLTRHFFETFNVIGYPSDHHIGEYIGYADSIMGSSWHFGTEHRKLEKSFPPITSNMSYMAWCQNISLKEYLSNDPDKKGLKKIASDETLTKDDIGTDGEIALPVIADIEFDRKIRRPAVNVLNTDRYIENLDKDACIEAPAVADKDGLHPEHVGRLPEGFAAQVRLQNSIQKLITEAYEHKSKELLLQALLIDPVVHSAEAAKKTLDTMFELQEDFLPSWKNKL